MSQSFCQPDDLFAFSGAKPWRLSCCRICAYVSSVRSGRDSNMATRIAENPFQQYLRPCCHTELLKWLQISLRRLAAHQASFGKWAHHYHTQAKIGGEW